MIPQFDTEIAQKCHFWMETNYVGCRMNRSKIKTEPHGVVTLCTVIFLFGLFIISTVILASVPPVSKDALVHHLAVPELYLKHGGIYEIPSMSFSYYPMNLDLLYLISLYFGNDIIPKCIHFCFALLTAWLILGYLKRQQMRAFHLDCILTGSKLRTFWSPFFSFNSDHREALYHCVR